MRLFQVLLYSFLAYSIELTGQSPPSLFETLYGLEEVKIVLSYPFDSLYRTNQEEISAVITIESKSGPVMKDESMTLNLRGKFRRMKCSMPPLLLNFKKSTLRNLALKDIDEMKLVTHCLDTQEGQENLSEERMCYEVYEAVTPYSYRTIWVTVDYIDQLNPENRISSAGFLLEPDNDINSRLGLNEHKLFNVAEDSLHFESYGHAAAFNFLIGNRDWSIVMSRNAKLFYDSRLHKYIVIPYDFDYSNIVAPSYRRETRPQSMVNPYDRIYQGEYFKTKSGDILKSFTANKSIILERVMTAPNPMNEGRRKNIAKYFETWFSQIEKSSVKDLNYGIVVPYKWSL
jgi:hypothetical protein